jgi:Xaa-Pro aminopeptidase
MGHELRRARLTERLPALGADALLVSRLPNVRYLTGFSGSNGQVLVGPAGSVFLTDGRYDEQSRREVGDLERRIYLDGFPALLQEVCRVLGVTRLGFEAAGTTVKSLEELEEGLEGIELVSVGTEVERLRWVKEEPELLLIEHAQELTDAGFDELPRILRQGVSERKAALELELAMRRAGADGLAFDTIVAFGEGAAEPHHHPTDRELRRGDVVKVDFGALHDGYHADMTRTLAFGEVDQGLLEVYDLVRAAQQAGVEAVRAGRPAAEVDAASRSVIADAGYGDAFLHGLGHGVGLEIHEGPTVRRTSEDVLPEGTVVTIEPGVYLPGRGGVRIEDMVHVTAEGGRVLPRASKELIVL